MMEVLGNRVIVEGGAIQFDNNIFEAAECDGKIIVVFDTDEDAGYDNVYCYTLEKKLIWRIKPVPVKIGGTARTPYVGVDIVNGKCRIIDFFGRRFIINIETGEIISKDIVR